MEEQREYRLLYQDIAGGWHETAFTFRQHDLNVTLRGPIPTRRVPRHVRDLAQVVRAPESL
jgi:hypothetical protein